MLSFSTLHITNHQKKKKKKYRIYQLSNQKNLHGYWSFVILFFFLSLLIDIHFQSLLFHCRISHRNPLSLSIISSSSSLKVPWLDVSPPLIVAHHFHLHGGFPSFLTAKPSPISPLTLARPKPKQIMLLVAATSVEIFLILFFLCLICGFGDLDLIWLLKI